MEENKIKQELARFNVTDAAIAEMSSQYMGMTINGLDDAKGYKAVHDARMVIIKKRTAVTKTGKELREDANRFNKAVLTEEKRILALLSPIEAHLDSEETKIDNEKARIKAEVEAKEAARIHARVDRLEALGMGLVAGSYRLPFGDLSLSYMQVSGAEDDQFDMFVVEIQEALDAENARLEENERARKAEAERLAKVAFEQAAERKRLEEVAKVQAAETKRIADEQTQREAEIKAEQNRVRQEQEQREAAIKAAQEAIEAEKRAMADAKQKAIDDARRAEELEQARKEAAEKARIEAEGRAEREAQEKEVARLKAIEDERLAKIAAEEEARRQEELRPDKEKLLDLADYLDAITYPLIKNKKLASILTVSQKSISEIAQGIRNDVGFLLKVK